MGTIPSEGVGTIPSEGVDTILVRGWALFLVRGWALFLVRGWALGHYSLSESRKRAQFLVRVDQDTIPLVRAEKLFFWLGSHGHVGSLG